MPGMGELIIIFMILLVLPLTGFWIWIVVDVATKEKGDQQVLWLLLVILAGIIGATVYFFARRPDRIKQLGR